MQLPTNEEVLADSLLWKAKMAWDAAGKTEDDMILELDQGQPGPLLSALDSNTSEGWAALERRELELAVMSYSEYLRSPEWAVQRARALKRAGGRCQGCNTTSHLETHHRSYGARGEERISDLTVLCAGCHTAVHLVADGRRGKVRNQSRRAP